MVAGGFSERSKNWRHIIMKTLFVILLTLLFPVTGLTKTQSNPSRNFVHNNQLKSYDVIVYGGTAGGVMAAIAAAEQNVKVALLEPGRHIGGMLSGGLGRTDMDRQQDVIGGFAREFFVRAGKYYNQPIAWTFEPKVAEEILNEWLEKAKVEVFFGCRIETVTLDKNTITRIKMENGSKFSAKVFIDASYEGDLMARAGVSYTIGRESRDKYGESFAGIKEIQPGEHQISAPIRPYDSNGNLLPYVINDSKVGAVGEGDKKVQAYCFRVCLTDVKENQVPITRPKDYDRPRYELMRRFLVTRKSLYKSFGLPLGISRMPNGKTDINSGGGVSTNLPGASWEYPDADYKRRQEIWDEHLSYTKGLLYFLGHDEGVPKEIRDEMSRWGLAKDEFIDNGHWPHQLYIREGRRMLGEYIMTQHDLQRKREKYDTIGMGGYNMDVREVQWIAKEVYWFPLPKQMVLMEGYFSHPVAPYEIPYRCLLPHQGECDNLLVTSCVSASHMAYSSLRMEPQYMIMGQGAGVAGALAVKSKKPVHLIDITVLQQALKKQKQILALEDVNRE